MRNQKYTDSDKYQQEIAELVPFFDLLARFGFEDRQKEARKDRATASP